MATATAPAQASLTDDKNNKAAPAETLESLQAEYKKLSEDIDSLSDADFKRHGDIALKIRKMGAAKREAIAEAVAAFLKTGQTFADFYKAVVAKDAGKAAEVTSLFNAEQIAAAYKATGGTVGKGTGKGKPKKAGETTAVDPNNVIKFDGNGSRPPIYNKDDYKQSYTKQVLKDLYEKNPEFDKFVAALSASYTESGKTYFATEEGKKELVQIHNAAKTKKVAPKAAAKTTAAPAPAAA